MIFNQTDTFRQAALTAFGGLIAASGNDNELTYVKEECGFNSKAVRVGLASLEVRAATLMERIKETKNRKTVGAFAAGMFETLSFYLQTSDAYDDEDLYVEYVIGGMNKMMSAFELVSNG